jgi:hypothetical protein
MSALVRGCLRPSSEPPSPSDRPASPCAFDAERERWLDSRTRPYLHQTACWCQGPAPAAASATQRWRSAPGGQSRKPPSRVRRSRRPALTRAGWRRERRSDRHTQKVTSQVTTGAISSAHRPAMAPPVRWRHSGSPGGRSWCITPPGPARVLQGLGSAVSATGRARRWLGCRRAPPRPSRPHPFLPACRPHDETFPPGCTHGPEADGSPLIRPMAWSVAASGSTHSGADPPPAGAAVRPPGFAAAGADSVAAAV